MIHCHSAAKAKAALVIFSALFCFFYPVHPNILLFFRRADLECYLHLNKSAIKEPCQNFAKDLLIG